MAGASHLLRKAALEKMSSPEQLDMAMRVTSPMGWLALSTLGAIVVVGVLWSVFATLDVKVDGNGILLRGDVMTVQATANSRIVEVLVDEGDVVQENDPVVRFDLPDEEITKLESERTTIQSRLSDLQSDLSRFSASANGLIRSLNSQIAAERSRYAEVQKLVDKGYKTENDLRAIRSTISSFEAQIQQQREGIESRRDQVAEQQRKLAQIENTLGADRVLRSRYGGRVAAIQTSEGELVTAGKPLVLLEDADAEFHFMVFIPMAEGKRVEPGMRILLSPTTTKPEEVGYIVGNVEAVSSLPVSLEEVENTLSNPQLAQKFSKETPFRVMATPVLDPSTPSGFEWTSSSGPAMSIGSSTPVIAQVVVDERKPISYVIPMVKKTLGVAFVPLTPATVTD